MRWRGELNAMLSCDGEVPEGEAFGSAFAAAVAAAAETHGTERIENGARVVAAVDAADARAAEAQLEEILEHALEAGFGALAGADRDFGWTAGVRGTEPVRDRQ